MRTELCDRFGIEYPIFVFTPSEKVAAAVNAIEKPVSPVRKFELVDVEDGFFMVHKDTQKVYRADLGQDGDNRALLDQQVGLFKDGEILPIFDDDM
jgi:hypothetical protein